MLLEVTSATWIVTGLGFGVVLILLFCLVFVMKGFGWIMQKLTEPKKEPAPKEQPVEQKPAEEKKSREVIIATPESADEATRVAIATALAKAGEDDLAAVAMALYLYKGTAHDAPTAMIAPQARHTAWNFKSIGLNNVGF